MLILCFSLLLPTLFPVTSVVFFVSLIDDGSDGGGGWMILMNSVRWCPFIMGFYRKGLRSTVISIELDVFIVMVLCTIVSLSASFSLPPPSLLKPIKLTLFFTSSTIAASFTSPPTAAFTSPPSLPHFTTNSRLLHFTSNSLHRPPPSLLRFISSLLLLLDVVSSHLSRFPIQTIVQTRQCV
ncbi:hypothetical protein QVD17_39331 [Tagetes erecta]|uniref:Uncharacterized protein n=1 Tax=Tagetes erecta TaxID=13708 RepID=A0AAD8JND3_TARER|nr:hypothetical protein QVD17_39331 [Tagetes erecta]